MRAQTIDLESNHADEDSVSKGLTTVGLEILRVLDIIEANTLLTAFLIVLAIAVDSVGAIKAIVEENRQPVNCNASHHRNASHYQPPSRYQHHYSISFIYNVTPYSTDKARRAKRRKRCTTSTTPTYDANPKEDSISSTANTSARP